MTAKLARSSEISAPDAKSRRHRRARRLLVTLAIVLAVLLAVVLLLPVWASTAQGRSYVLDQINRDLRGKITVEKWSLGWFTGLEAQGVTLTDESGQPILQCAAIKTELTLLSILRGRYDFGDTAISRPRLFLRRYADGSTNVNRVFNEPGGPGPAANRTRANWQQMIGRLRGALKVDGGSLVMSAEGTAEIICLEDIQGDMPIASPSSPVHLSVVGRAVHEQTRQPVSIEASVPSLIAWSANPLIVLQDINIEAAAIPVAPLAAWAGLSPRWDQSFGPTLDMFKLENHEPRGTEWSVPHLEARGSRGSLSLILLMQTTPGATTLSLVSPSDYYKAHLLCAPSLPADALLAYCNPFVAGLRPGTGTIEVTLTELEMPLNKWTLARATGNLSLSLVRQTVPAQLRGLGFALPASTGECDLAVPPARFTIGGERLATDGMAIGFQPAPPLVFSGWVGLADASVHLLLTGNTQGTGALSDGTVRLPIRGTVDRPIVMQPGAATP